MKLQPLATHLMQDFGTLLSQLPPLNGLQMLELSTEANQPLLQYCCSEPVLLEYSSGMPVVMLERSEYPSPQFFYLDRLLKLKPNTVFAFAAMSPNCSVRVYLPQSATLSPMGTLPQAVLPTRSIGLQVEQIYTTFSQESNGSFYFRGEQHHPYELVYLTRGSLHNVSGGQDIILEARELLMFDQDTWHMQYSDDAVSFLTVSFTLNGDLISSLCGRKLHPDRATQTLLTQILQERALQDVYSDDRIEALLRMVLIDLLRNEAQSLPATATKSSPKTLQSEREVINQAVQYIGAHIQSKIPLPELAAAVHVSVPHLCRIFSAHMGMPPGQYISRIRLEECKVALRSNRHSIGEVAQQFGFSSVQQFSRQFRRLSGLTPSEYLRSL